MSDALRIIVGLVVFAHGVGHVLFLGPAMGLGNWAGQTSQSWILTAVVGDGATRAIAAVLWSAVVVLFVAGVGGFFVGSDWWRGAIVAGSIVSIVGIVAFWGDLAMPSAIFALVTDAVILAALLLAQWPSRELVGS